MKKLIQWLLLKLKDRATRRLIAKLQKVNPNPKYYRLSEHRDWGDRIDIIGNMMGEQGQFRIVGWLPRKPIDGDRLVYECESGKLAEGIICETEYPGDPNDMFFATIFPIGYYNENNN